MMAGGTSGGKRDESEGDFHILVTAGARSADGGGGAAPHLRYEPEELVPSTTRRSLR